MTKPALLILNENAGRMLGDALAERFEYIRLWEAPDADARLAERGADVVVTDLAQLLGEQP